jgi:hypothetical protein
VSNRIRRSQRVSTDLLCPKNRGFHRAPGALPAAAVDSSDGETPVLDLVYVLVAIAVFAVIGVVAWGVEKL